MSIASEITRLQGAKSTLKTKLNALNDNEHQITDETLDEYGDFVDTIVSDPLATITSSHTSYGSYGGYAAYYLSSVNIETTQAGCAYLFNNFRNAKKIQIKFNVAPTTVEGMFTDCRKLQEIVITGTNPLKATNMSSLFNSCSNLSSFPLIDTSTATNISRNV